MKNIYHIITVTAMPKHLVFSLVYSRHSLNKSLKQNCCLNRKTAYNIIVFIPEYLNLVRLSVNRIPVKLNIISWSI